MSDPDDQVRTEALDDGRVRVHFGRVILEHEKPKRFVTFRPPKIGEMLDHDDPVSFVTDDTAVTPMIDRAALAFWVRLLMLDHDLDFIAQVEDPAIGYAIIEAVSGFFTNARKRFGSGSAPSSHAA